tara:strand:- start:51 stop:1568 length:1518 start_codon:yes stop_codon:yes gene_type:complete
MPSLEARHYSGKASLDTIPEALATMIVNGEPVEYDEGTKSGVITSYVFGKTKYDKKETKIVKGESTEKHVNTWAKMTTAKDLLFFMGDIPVKSNQIYKTVDFGGGGGGKQGFNMGNVSEGIFAAAVFAKFWIGRDKQIGTEEVIKVLDVLSGARAKKVPGKKSVQGEFMETAPNQKKGIPPDNIYYQFGLAANNHLALINSDNWRGKKFLGIMRYACAYANSTQVSKWVDLIYTNGRVDNIVVHADGEANQKGTKVDVKVFCSDNNPDDKRLKKLNINVSLKIDGIKQFGQVGGTDYENQLIFWTQLFPGIKLDNPIDENKYNAESVSLGSTMVKGKMVKATEYAKSLEEYYKAMQKQLKRLASTPGTKENDELAAAFAKGVRFYGSLNEPNVELLDIHHIKGATSVDLDKIEKLLKGKGIKISEVVMSNPKEGNKPTPTIRYQVMIDDKWVDFLQTRVKKSGSNARGPYYRNIIEKLSGFSKLLGVKVEEDGSFEFRKTTNKYY